MIKEDSEKKTAFETEVKNPASRGKILSLLGLAQRGGYLTVGFDAVCNSAEGDKADKHRRRTRTPRIILIAEDISEKSEKELRFAVKSVDVVRLPIKKEDISRAIGLNSLVGIVAVNDSGFSKAIKKHL